MKHKGSSFERILPLNPDLEKAVLYAVIHGKMDSKGLKADEFSKLGRIIHKVVQTLTPPVPVKTVFLAATEVHNADKDELRTFLKEIERGEIPEIQAIISTLSRKRIINTLVNEAADQVASGDYSLLALKELVNRHTHVRNTLVPIYESLTGNVTPPQGVPVPCLPTLTRVFSGVYGVWLIGGGPAAGKSTLALQVSMSIGRRMPVLYYDFEQGTDVIKWHIFKALGKDKDKIREATHQMYIRHSMSSLESDLDLLQKPCLIVVDSIQKVASAVTYRRESLDHWVHKLESLKKYGHHIIMISEKNRATYDDPSIKGYKESGELEFSADSAFDMILPNRDDGSRVDVYVTKNRHYKTCGHIVTLERDPQNVWWFNEPQRKGQREVD